MIISPFPAFSNKLLIGRDIVIILQTVKCRIHGGFKQYKFPITAKNSDDSPFMRVATSHTSSENGLLLQIFSPSGTMAALNIYSGTHGKRITTDCELPKNYVAGTFPISSSSANAIVTLGFEPSFVVLCGGDMQAYTGVAWITSTGFETPILSSVYSGTWTYIAFK